ncbi:hypothetical protein E4U61_007181, partial [Claviceps capensis]
MQMVREIACVRPARPVAGERYCLRLLLMVVRGPKYFEDFTTSRMKGFRRTTPLALRTMFLIGLREQMIANPLAIWD